MGFISSYLMGRLMNFAPVVSKQGDTLVIASGWRSHLFSLGAASRRITVEPQRKVLHINGRRFWFARWSRRIEFEWIQDIAYGYWSTGQGWYGEGAEDEMYTVGLNLKNGEEVILCRFFGSGDYYNNTIMPDWCYWGDQYSADLAHGTQNESSHALLDVLSRLLGVPVNSMKS